MMAKKKFLFTLMTFLRRRPPPPPLRQRGQAVGRTGSYYRTAGAMRRLILLLLQLLLVLSEGGERGRRTGAPCCCCSAFQHRPPTSSSSLQPPEQRRRRRGRRILQRQRQQQQQQQQPPLFVPAAAARGSMLSAAALDSGGSRDSSEDGEAEPANKAAMGPPAAEEERRSKEGVGEGGSGSSADRRRFLLSLPLSAAAFFVGPNDRLVSNSNHLLLPPAASARGLIQFPCEAGSLLNTYHLMRAGTSLLEEQDIWSTNPLFLTNREDALSPSGQEQVRAAARQMRGMDKTPTIVTHSLAAACIDSANVVARELKLGRDRIQPEYTFLDPRAIGKWDMLSKAKTQPAVWAMDNDAAGPGGMDEASRPPPNTDGTPHETLSDQAIRLRQYLSLIESRSSGDTILFIFPDGTGPALLSAMIAGIPYNRVHELEFESGELRLDVTKESTLRLWESRQNNQAYQQVLDEGRKTLSELQGSSPDSIVSIRDQQIEEERVAIDKVYFEQQQARQRANEEKNQRTRAARQREIAEQREGGDAGAPTSPAAIWGVSGAIAVAGAAVALNAEPDVADPSDDDLLTESVSPPLGGNDTDAILATAGGDSAATASLYGGQSPSSQASAANNYRVNGDSKTSTFNGGGFPPEPVDPYKAAKKAMQDYLDQDDGGEAWLQSIAEIAREEETDDEQQQ